VVDSATIRAYISSAVRPSFRPSVRPSDLPPSVRPFVRTPDRPTEYYKSFSRWPSVETTAQIGRRRAGQGRGACLNRITVIVLIMLKSDFAPYNAPLNVGSIDLQTDIAFEDGAATNAPGKEEDNRSRAPWMVFSDAYVSQLKKRRC